MVQVRFCLLLAALSACCGLCSSGDVDSKIIPIPFIAKSESKAEALKQADPSVDTPDHGNTTDTNTTSATNTSTSSTTSTTPAPDTTTSTTSTTPAPDTTTSTTSTTPAPAPTPAPGPLPPPEEHTWYYTNQTTNVTCIVVQFAAQLNVTYTKSVDKNTTLAHVLLNVPANATVVDGSCGPTEQFLTLSWPVPASNVSNTMTISYTKNDTTKLYALKSLELQLSPDLFADALFNTTVVLSHGSAWSTPLSTSYRCVPPTRFNMTSDATSRTAAALTFTKLQEEAFRNGNGTGFSAARECGGDVPDAVPIAVGCALGGLVVVVLIAYLVGRRRSNARGYLSM